jgi:hypothetical protein
LGLLWIITSTGYRCHAPISTQLEAEISFMKQKKSLFQWPSTEDILWVTQEDIICKIKDPKP